MAGSSIEDPDVFRLVVEQTRDYAVFVLDTGGHIRSWNLGAQRIKGYAPHEIIGRHFSVFYNREAVERGWPDYELKVAAMEGRFEDEGWRLRKGGSLFWASVIITALRDESGRLLGYSKITRDLTERRMNEEALRQSEERFRLLVEGVVDYAIFMLDPEGVITSWNAGAERIKGYARDDILGRHFSRFYTPEDRLAGKPWEEIATARRTGRCETEGWRVRKNGERFWARTVLNSLHDPEGRLRGYAKVTQDLSERRYMQDLEKAARNVNEFIAMLAHELRNPLAPIRHAAQLLSALPPGDPSVEPARRTIERQSAQLARIVDDMIDIARITRGELVVERERVDMAEIAQRAIETALPAIEAGAHRLQLDLPAAQVFVAGDEHRLAQALTNLLNNAARYTPRGGTIFLKAGVEDGMAVVRVRDTGRGIAPAMLERIFDMFVQGRQPMERVGGGLGVGLALARRIVELHHGTLEARSEGEGRGAEFVIRLALVQGGEERRQPAAPPLAVSPGAASRRVLVVDDNVDAADTLNMLLAALGYTTAVSHDGLDALQKAAEFLPDIVLLDIGMPGLDGYEVARRLRAQQRERAVRIVAVTGWGQESDRRRSSEAGFDLHLVKPVDLDTLTRALGDGATLH